MGTLKHFIYRLDDQDHNDDVYSVDELEDLEIFEGAYMANRLAKADIDTIVAELKNSLAKEPISAPPPPPAAPEPSLWWQKRLLVTVIWPGLLFCLVAYWLSNLVESANRMTRIESSITTLARDLNTLDNRVGKIDERVSRLELEMVSVRLRLAAQGKDSREAGAVLAEAKTNRTPIPQDALARVGSAMVNIAKENADAWPVALDFAAYKTEINAASITRPTSTLNLNSEREKYAYALHGPNGLSKPKPLIALPFVSAENAARLHFIGKDPNSGKPGGSGTLILMGGNYTLDRIHAKNIIFEDVTIHYQGGPVILENVLFLRCKFVFSNTEGSRSIANSVLASSRVNTRVSVDLTP